MQVTLPRLGEGADSGTVATIFVKEGDEVKQDQPILELESEKAVASIPSPVAGRIGRVHVREGDMIKVGQLIFTIEEGAGGSQRAVDARVGDEEPEPVSSPPLPTYQPPAPVVPADVLAEPTGPVPPASPTIRKMARDLGIDLRRVKGSERGGRVVLEDLRRYIQGLQHLAHAPRLQTSAEQAPQPVRVDFARWGPVESRKMSTLRKTISTKMVESWTAVPHVTQFDNADVTRILDLRKKYAGSYEAKGARLTLTSFALRSIVNTLKRHPVFNASMGEASGEIVYKQYYHLGIAVDTEHGLIVPVIRDVDKKSLLQISVELQELAQRTRDRKVSLEEMQGGTFSISNQGGIGSGHFTPIINTPELAILGMGKGVLTPVIRDGSVVPKTLLPLSLSYDHRLIDGADAARFMVDLVHDMENFPENDVTI